MTFMKINIMMMMMANLEKIIMTMEKVIVMMLMVIRWMLVVGIRIMKRMG